MNNNRSIIALMVIAGVVGCKPDYIEPEDTKVTNTDGYGDTGGDTGDTEGIPNPDVCFPQNAPANAVRWQCEGFAQAAVIFTINEEVELPELLTDEQEALILAIFDYGRLDWHSLFGPVNSEEYDEPGIDACCLPDIPGADEESVDETGTDTSGDEAIPQPALACADDCADQACRQLIRELRRAAEAIPGAVSAAGEPVSHQLIEVSNWLATGQPCFDALTAGGVSQHNADWIIEGTLDLPPSELWPAIDELSVSAECLIYDWYLPEQGEPHTCTGINDNNGEDPFEGGGSGGGSGFETFDTFAPTHGEMRLDGPVLFGVHAVGSAPILGLGEACPRGECSRVDAWITESTLELQRMVLVPPSSMSWEQDGMRLTIDGLHAIMEYPRSIPLLAAAVGSQFAIPAGELEMVLAGRIHGVPLAVTVPNVTPVTGTVSVLDDGSHRVLIDAFAVEHRDGYGTWTMNIELGELVAIDHSPRASFGLRASDEGAWLDASASFDPDGDALTFEWFHGGELIGAGPTFVPNPTLDLGPLMLRVTDATGRSAWIDGLRTPS